MMIIHKRKKSIQDLDEVKPIYIPKIENNYNLYSQNNKNNYSLNNNSSSPSDKSHKYALKTIRLNSPLSKYDQTSKYSSNTFHHYHSSSNSHKNTEENKRKNNDVIIPKIKTSLSNQQYNLTDINKVNNSTSFYNNLKSLQTNNTKIEPFSVNIKSDKNNKYNLDNQRYKNHQTKSSNFSTVEI